MAEFIERKALREAFENANADVVEEYEDGTCDWGFGHQNILEVINSVPAADVAPVRHGWWICKYDPTYGLTDITCSRCRDARSIEGCYEGTNGESLWDQENYCPNCGARMDGGYD